MRTALRLAIALVALAAPAHALAGTQVLTFRSAPITIGPFEVSQSLQLAPSPSADGYVTAMSADVVDGAGNIEPLEHVMLHHVVFGRGPGSDSTCGGLGGERFYAAGEERATLQLPAGYGYANRATDRWGLLYMLMNHRNVRETVYVQYRVTYVTGEQLAAVRPVWLDVRNCSSDPVFDVPGTGGRGSTFTESWLYRMPESGRFVAGAAHLHGGGIRLELANATCGTSVFTSWPTWGGPEPRPVMHEPGPAHMSGFSSPGGIPVSAGDTLKLSAVYDNSWPHTRVMGIMMAYLAPGPVAACSPPPLLDPDPLSRPGYPPRTVLPLLKQPAGKLHRDAIGTWVGDYAFGAQRVSIRRGTTFTWRFVGAVDHDVTLATGPVGFSSPHLKGGASFAYRFLRPGTYKLFCSLHPTRMTQVVTVR